METKGDENTQYAKHIRNILLVFLVIFAISFLKLASSILLPIVIAMFLFMLLNPILNRLDGTRIPRLLSTLIVMILVVLVSAVFIYVLFLIVNMLLSKLPYYAMRVNEIDMLISQYIAPLLGMDGAEFSIIDYLDINWYTLAIQSLSSFSSSIIDLFSDWMLVFLYLLFILLERSSFPEKIMSVLSPEKALRVSKLSMKINRQIAKYIFLKLMISLITGFLFYAVAILTGLDFALAWGVLATILNFIPTIGSIIVTAGTIIMAVIQFMPSWITVLYIAVLMISIEMIMGNIIDPKLQGVKLNISPLVILISLAFWGYIWGLAGMFLAVPITSTLQIFMANIPSLKGIAVILSTGKIREEGRIRHGKMHENTSDDIQMPEIQTLTRNSNTDENQNN